MLRTDETGNIVGGTPNGGDACVLQEGVNILVGDSYLEDPTVGSVNGNSQQTGDDGNYGKMAAQIGASAKVGGGDNSSTLLLVPEGPLSQKHLQTAVNAEVADLLKSTMQIQITHQGWFKPGTGSLWELGDKVKVKSPMLFPTADGVSPDLRVYTVTCRQDAQGGSTTTVELVNETIFTRRFPDGNAGSPFDQSAQGAKPEVDA